MDPQTLPAAHQNQHHRPTTDAGPAGSSYNWVFAIVLVLSLGFAAGGIVLAIDRQGWAMLAAGGTCVVATLLSWALAGTIASSRGSGGSDMRLLIDLVTERLEQFSVMLNLISEQQLLSDRGKSIAYRAKDREALRFAIHEEVNRGDFEAALRLAEEMDRSFGSRQEADRYRLIIETRREELTRRHVSEAMATIDKYIRAEQWSQAVREAEAYSARYPDETQLRNLPAEVENRRQLHKKQLLDSFQDAANRHDVDAAMVLMKRLDAYLSPAEAESLQETARSIVKAKLESLKEQFSRAVHESNWHEALRIGDVIIRDFPNTQMAKEVRENLDALKQRASVPAGA